MVDGDLSELTVRVSAGSTGIVYIFESGEDACQARRRRQIAAKEVTLAAKEVATHRLAKEVHYYVVSMNISSELWETSRLSETRARRRVRRVSFRREREEGSRGGGRGERRGDGGYKDMKEGCNELDSHSFRPHDVCLTTYSQQSPRHPAIGFPSRQWRGCAMRRGLVFAAARRVHAERVAPSRLFLFRIHARH